MQAHRKYRVLSAGNEESSVLLTAVLGYSDIKVVAAGTIVDAVRSAGTGGFDAYILETRFPDGDGYELCRRLKIESPDVPVVFYTGDVMEKERAMGLLCGADAYLGQPYEGDIGTFMLALIHLAQVRKIGYEPARLRRRADMQQRVGANLSL